MEWFIVRVKLHKNPLESGISENFYNKLHADMAAQGYYRYTQDDSGEFVMLPPAEYFTQIEGSFDPRPVRDRVTAIVAKTGRIFTVLATSTSHWASQGLQRITSAQALALRTNGRF